MLMCVLEKLISGEHGDVELKPLSPTNTCQSSLSAIKAMESFIRFSFGLNEHKETVPSTPRSTGSPRYSNTSDKSGLSKLNDVVNDENVHMSSPKLRSRAPTVDSPPTDDSVPTDLTSSTSRHRKTADVDVKLNLEADQSAMGRDGAMKKTSPLTGTRDADSSTSPAGEISFSGNEEDATDCRTNETASKSSTRDEKRKAMHGRKRPSDHEQHHGLDSKHTKNEDHHESYSSHQRPQHKSTKDDLHQYANQERPCSSTSSSRRSALESLHGLVYGQSLNTEHPLDSLQRLIYGGAAAAVTAGAATAADVGLTAETPGASAFGSGTASLMGGVGAGFMNDLINGHHVTAGKGPFGSTTTSFHSSMLGPQTLILVNPIVTVVSQAGGGVTGGGSSLSITLPGPPAAALPVAASAASPSTPLLPLNFSKSTSGESSSSSAGSSPSDIGACSATAAAGSRGAVDFPSAGDGSMARSSTPPPRIYRCRACRRKFSSKGSYRYHLSRCHVLASSSLPASKSPKAASEPPATATTAVASATVSVTSGGDVHHRSKSMMMSSMSDSGEVHSSNAVRPSGGMSNATSAATTNLSGTPYGGCLPLNGSARLQTRYLAMDAGAQ